MLAKVKGYIYRACFRMGAHTFVPAFSVINATVVGLKFRFEAHCRACIQLHPTL